MLLAIALTSTVYAETATAQLSVSPTDNAAIVTVTGAGFDASENVTLELIANNTSHYTFTETIETDDEGAFAANITLPTGMYGTFNLTASTSSVTAYTEYTIENMATITASPDNSNVITVTGSRFDASEIVWLGLVDSEGEMVYEFTETVETDETGNFSTMVIVPTSIHGTFNLTATTSNAVAYVEYTVPDLTGPTGSAGEPGTDGVQGEAGQPGESVDMTILYGAIGIGIFAVVLAAYAILRKS